MPFAQKLRPDQFLAEDFDEAWARGWFRMRQNLFTTHFLEFERRFFAAVWLRVGLPGMVPDKKFLELKKRNRTLRVQIGPLGSSAPDLIHENLYAAYRDSLPFQPAPNLGDLLFGSETESLFFTWQIDLFENETLVASGYFDLGNRAAAGITCFYDPAYKKQSLGTYLIYLKMEFCRDHGLEFFYPGYLAPGEMRFDYKRHIGAATLEYLELATGDWRPYPSSQAVNDPLAEMEARLKELHEVLESHQLNSRFQRYLHLDINLNPQVQGMALFDFPVFLDCFPVPGVCPALVVVFDPRNDCFHLFHNRSVYRFDTPSEGEIFGSDLLLADRLLFSTAAAEEMAACLEAVTVVSER